MKRPDECIVSLKGSLLVIVTSRSETTITFLLPRLLAMSKRHHVGAVPDLGFKCTDEDIAGATLYLGILDRHW